MRLKAVAQQGPPGGPEGKGWQAAHAKANLEQNEAIEDDGVMARGGGLASASLQAVARGPHRNSPNLAFTCAFGPPTRRVQEGWIGC